MNETRRVGKGGARELHARARVWIPAVMEEGWRCTATALLCVGALWSASGTQRERPMLAARTPAASAVTALEARMATVPSDSPISISATRELIQAYLDAHRPGLAVVLVAAASPDARGDVYVGHVYARALMEQGRNGEALAVERGVLERCLGDDARPAPECDDVLIARATRRIHVLQALLARGVEDTPKHPEASYAAYQNATREARIVLE